MNCKTCNNLLSGRQRVFCSKQCKAKDINNKHNDYAAQKQRSIMRKTHFVNQFGGKCSICGYSKNLAALCFHHIDGGKTKEFGVDSRQFSNRSIAALEKELKKCILICSNCHMQEHYPELNDWNS